MIDVPWDDRPPADAQDRIGIQVMRLQPGQEEFFRLLGPWKGCWHHWTPRCSTACLGAERNCPLCPDPQRFWECYTPSLVWNRHFIEPTTGKPVGRWQPVVCPLIAPIAADLARLSDGITGLVMKLRREKGRRKLHTWKVLERTSPAYNEPLAQPFDVVPILLRMWRLFWLLRYKNLGSTIDQVAWQDNPQTAPPEGAQPG